MIPAGLITYSTAELERMAAELLRRRPDVEFSAPINIELLVENEKNVSLEFLDGLRDKYHVEGAVSKLYMSKNVIVHVDHSFLSRPWAMYNEVLGEELAHIRLHPALFQNFINSIEDFIEIQGDPQWARYESDAKKFSAMIRMPAQLMMPVAEEAYSRIVREHGFSDLANIEKLVRNDLAMKFRVSPNQVRQRMSDGACQITHRLTASFAKASMILLPLESHGAERITQ